MPTDNLYKFMAITGVAVILTATFFMTSRIEEIYEKVFDLSKNISLLEESIKTSEIETEELSKIIATLTKKQPKKLKPKKMHCYLYIQIRQSKNSLKINAPIAFH